MRIINKDKISFVDVLQESHVCINLIDGTHSTFVFTSKKEVSDFLYKNGLMSRMNFIVENDEYKKENGVSLAS